MQLSRQRAAVRVRNRIHRCGCRAPMAPCLRGAVTLNYSGGLRHTRAPARGHAHALISGMHAPVDRTAGEVGSGLDRLRADRKTVTLHRLRSDSALADLQQRRLNSQS